MREQIILFLAVSLGCALPVACSSSNSATGGADASASDASHAGDAGPDVIIDPQNCIAPGTPNNAFGVGGYCSPGGNQCAHAGNSPTGTICTGDFGSIVPPHAWFCTDLCDIDAGPNACGQNGPPCVPAEGEFVCLPDACMGFLSILDSGAAPMVDAPSGEASAAGDAQSE